MEKTQFIELLFETACCAMACDGHIDDREIRELKYIDRSTTYFKDIDLSHQLTKFVADVKENKKVTIGTLINKLNTTSKTTVEELLLLEVALRIIYADTKINEDEIEFLQSIRSTLSLRNEIIKDRFGSIEILLNNRDKLKEPTTQLTDEDIIRSKSITNVEEMYHDVRKRKKKN